jgi:YD repeat-containing protein
VTHPDLKTLRFVYKGRDLEQIIDEKGTVTAYDFCAVCGALEEMRAPLSKELRWTHNGDHDLTAFVDARLKTTAYTYGSARELKQLKYADGHTENYTYDSFGRFKTITDGIGRKRTYSYDPAGRVRIVSFTSTPTQPSISYTYYTDSRLHTMSDEAGTTTFKYSPGRLVDTVTYDYSSSGLSGLQELKYLYNHDNTLASLTWTSGGMLVAKWSYTYDGAGRMKTISNSSGLTITRARSSGRQVPTSRRSRTSIIKHAVGRPKLSTNKGRPHLLHIHSLMITVPTR